MRVRNQPSRWWAVILICLAAGGCASTGAPDDWLSVAKDAPQDPYGSWVTVEFVKSHDEQFLMGEFLAVDNDSIYVLSVDAGTGDPVVGISRDIIKKTKIASFDPQMANASGWVATGAISTLSHGLGAAITMPIWVIFGSAMAAGHSRSPLENYPNLPWDELNMYARFPQGPPPGLHELGLHPKRLEDPDKRPKVPPGETLY
jgi:hypothetical protein